VPRPPSCEPVVISPHFTRCASAGSGHDLKKSNLRGLTLGRKRLAYEIPDEFQFRSPGAMHYEVIRSVNDKSLHIIFPEGTFGVLPDLVRRLGPWRGVIGGQIITLKPHYRVQLAEQGFVLLYQSRAKFSAEELPQATP